ncbi:cell envelope integrity EipB family protein [Breoghania sp.]|uniref:cell envelope integrity EipB family protein n=1 Tax=Breoghania sp. TaxID=2065378 RepID=UPI002AA6728A|nr:cell envelope integrity EipB family protein [Breoghania sp.]
MVVSPGFVRVGAVKTTGSAFGDGTGASVSKGRPVRQLGLRFSRISSSGAMIALLAGGLVAAPVAVSAQETADLVPHRAVYDLSLDHASDRAGISGVDGRIVYDISGSRCEGYTSTFRLVMRIFDTQGKSQLSDLQSSAFELDGEYNFTVRTFANGAPIEDTLGVAVHGEDSIEVTLKRPEEEAVSIEGKALFPTEHTSAILATARAGEHLLQASAFDGSEDGKVSFPTLTVIGAPIKEPAQDKAAGDPGEQNARAMDDPAEVAKIDGKRAWPVTVSYYSANTRMEESEPEYQVSFMLYENGITRRLRMDYGEFAVAGALKSLELHDPAPACPTD